MGLPAEKNETMRLAEMASQDDHVKAMTSQMRQVIRQIPNGDVRNLILGYITEERYEKAIDSMIGYLNSKPEYPEFKVRSAKYVQYGCELIKAIQAKRSFPGWNALNMAKQKELFEKALLHFEDLRATLGKIEAIEKEVRLADMRTTVWVMRACVYAVCALVLFAFLRELTNGVIPSANVVVESTTNQFVDFIFEKLKL